MITTVEYKPSDIYPVLIIILGTLGILLLSTIIYTVLDYRKNKNHVYEFI